jgi:hypothetical protein
MTDQDIFGRETRPFGGRFVVPPGNPGVEKAYNDIATDAAAFISSARNALPRLPHIHFDFVLNGEVNAFAFKSSGRYFIGINTGTIYTLRLVFMRMLADARLFPKVGNPRKEARTLPALTSFIPNAQRLLEAGIMPVVPKTAARAAYAEYLFDFAFNFLVGHEIAHISLGHVDYMLSKKKLGWVSEQDRVVDEQIIERQSMEATADVRSVFSRIASIQLTQSKHGPQMPPWSDSPLTTEAMFFDWGLALHSTFRMFGERMIAPGNIVGTVHPPTTIRRLMASFCTYMAVRQWDPALQASTGRALRDAMGYAEDAFDKILGSERSVGELSMAKAQKYQERLANYSFGILRKKLRPFAYEDVMAGGPGP